MIKNEKKLVRKQFELVTEFGKYVFDHPEMDDLLTKKDTHVYFEVVGDAEFNAYSRNLAEETREKGSPVLMVRIDGLAPKQGSRFINPVFRLNGTKRKRVQGKQAKVPKAKRKC